MAQQISSSGRDPKLKPRTSSRVSSALKSGVVFGGSAVLTAVNNITPHIAGAVDILVIEQPDGSRKATPFYVRFGKYTALRTGERNVKLYVNDELAPFGMHIGMYGQAYFALETIEDAAADDDEQEALLADMMSPPSGYSSGGDEPAPAGAGRAETAETLKAVRQHIDGLKEARGKGAARTARGGTGAGAAGYQAVGGGPHGAGGRAAREPFPGLGLAPVGSGADTEPASAAVPGGTGAETSSDTSAFESQTDQPPEAPPPQLAPSLSMADRNESFLSARETLATPLGDDLAAAPSSVFMSFTAVPSTTSGRLSHPQLQQPQTPMHRQSCTQELAGTGIALQGATAADPDGVEGEGEDIGRVGSRDSLAGASEGGSPRGWSDEEVEREGTSPAWSCQAGASPAAVSGGSYGTGAGSSPGLPPAPASTQACRAPLLPPVPQQQQQHPHLGPQQPLHLQLGFPENQELATQQPSQQPSQVEGPKLHGTVDWTLALGPCSATDAAASRGAAGTGSSEGLAPALAPAAGAAAAAAPPAVVGLPPRSVALDTPGVGRHRVSPWASPGCGSGSLAAAAAAADGAAPPHGSGSGSHHAVSLLSTSLRGASVGSGGAAGESLADAGGPGPELALPSVSWLKAKGTGTAEAGPLPVLSASEQHVDTSVVAAGPGRGIGQGIGQGQSLRGGASPSLAGAVRDAGGSIAAAATIAATPSGSGQAVTLPAAAQARPHAVRALLNVTADGVIRLQLAVLPPATCAVPVGRLGGPLLELASCPSDSGYLGDVEPSRGSVSVRHLHHHHHHGYHHMHHYHSQHPEQLHSTSAPLPSSGIEAVVAAAAAAAVEGGSGTGACERVGSTRGPSSASASAAGAVNGLELSLCGALLTAQTPYPEAALLFDTHRVSEEVFATRGSALLASPDLIVRFANGSIYHWQSLSYSLVGLLAFGSWRLAPGTLCWTPAAGGSETDGAAVAAAAAVLLAAAAQGAGAATGEVPRGVSGGGGGAAASASANTTPKKGAAVASSSSWRLWMFGARRENGRTSATGGGTGTTTVTTTTAAVAVAASVTGRSPPAPLSPLAERAGSIEHPHSGGTRTQQQQPQQQQQQSGQGLIIGQSLAPGTAPASAEGQGADSKAASAAASGGGGGSRRPRPGVVTKKSLTPAPEQLAVLPLKRGQNTIVYKIGGSELKAYVYFLPWRTKIVISDIDGTITKSDVLGHLLPAMGLDWSHPGIAQLLTNIRHNNYLIMYLSSRSISQANITRDFINTLVQGEHRMPLGPVIISPHGLLPSLYREMILRRPHEFKIATLQDIRALFPPFWNPFFGGFGNRDTDEISYREVGVQPSRIFIINPRGELRQPVDLSKASSSTARAGDIGTGASEDVDSAAAAADPAAADPAAADSAPSTWNGAAPGSSAAGPAAGGAASASAAVSASSSFSREPSSFGRGAASSSVAAAAATMAAVSSGSARSRTQSGSVALSSLSAINELVDDIFPPLRDGESLPRDDDPVSSYDEAEEAVQQQQQQQQEASATPSGKGESTSGTAGSDEGAEGSAEAVVHGDGRGSDGGGRERTSSRGSDGGGEGRSDRGVEDGLEEEAIARRPAAAAVAPGDGGAGGRETGAAADLAPAPPVPATPRSACSPREGDLVTAGPGAAPPPPPPGASSTAVPSMRATGGKPQDAGAAAVAVAVAPACSAVDSAAGELSEPVRVACDGGEARRDAEGVSIGDPPAA